MTDDIRAAIAERMNRLPEVIWDRCSFGDQEGSVFGWIARDDGRSDFVALKFEWGTTVDLVGADVQWFHVGTMTSSAEFSNSIADRILGHSNNHRDCERVEHVLGELVSFKVVLDA